MCENNRANIKRESNYEKRKKRMDTNRIFNELAIARKMEETGEFILYFRQYELNIYAEYLRWKKSQELGKPLEEFTKEENVQADEEIEKELIRFSECAYSNFNYNVNYVEIDRAVENCRKYKILLPDPTPITAREWNTIKSIENDDYRRLLFVLLVTAKYKMAHRKTIGRTKYSDKYYIGLDDKKVLQMAKIKDKKSNPFYYLFQNGYIGHSKGGDYVEIVNNDSEVVEQITDYEHLDMHYDKLMGEKIGCCKKCGKLFKQTARNNGQYCYQHRGYQKVEVPKTKTVKCIDCGKEFTVSAKNTATIRCEECKKIYKREYYKEYRKRKAKVQTT